MEKPIIFADENNTVKLGIGRKKMLGLLKAYYNGYHFSRDLSVSVYRV